MSTNVIATNNQTPNTFGKNLNLQLIMAEIEELGYLPEQPVLTGVIMRRNINCTHYQCNIQVRGMTVRHGEYNDYFKNYQGHLQTNCDVYNFRWSYDGVPELVGYHILGGRKHWLKPNPIEGYITFR